MSWDASSQEYIVVLKLHEKKIPPPIKSLICSIKFLLLFFTYFNQSMVMLILKNCLTLAKMSCDFRYRQRRAHQKPHHFQNHSKSHKKTQKLHRGYTPYWVSTQSSFATPPISTTNRLLVEDRIHPQIPSRLSAKSLAQASQSRPPVNRHLSRVRALTTWGEPWEVAKTQVAEVTSPEEAA